MSANELRIGNWLMGRHPVQVFGINNSKSVNLSFGGNPYYVDTLDEFFPCLLPIEITKDILLKCGFEYGQSMERGNNKSDKCYSIQVSNSDYLEYKDSEFVIQNEFASISTKLWNQPEFIHELQNLYFALTNTELQVNF